MAFINERIPKEERCEYVLSYRKIKPRKWTIDKEKNVKLFKYWTNIDNPREKYFGLIWHDYIIEVILHEETKINTVFWSLESISIPIELKQCEKEIIEDLREAMKVYASDGTKFANGKSWSRIEVETIVCF